MFSSVTDGIVLVDPGREGEIVILDNITLDDKYILENGRIFLTGVQALVRLPLEQSRRDTVNNIRAAGYISGYRGSPLGGYDQQLWRARRHLAQHSIHFEPGLNEDLAATSVWGTQQVNLFEGARYQGVFSLWYGKGPGVDRCGDVFKHGNMAGSSRHGGVLLVAGDDHAAKSSTLPHQSEFAFMDAGIPVLNPSGVQEVLEYGLAGIALSRFSGCWIALKTTAENMDSSASIRIDPYEGEPALPDVAFPPDGLNIRWPDNWLEQETRLHRYKLPAAQAFARSRKLDRTVLDSPDARFGIVTAGKSYLDTRQALETLGIDDRQAAAFGIRLLKIGMSWPLDPVTVLSFADGLEEILVIEEKRSLIEPQLKACLYNAPPQNRPRIIGKHDEGGTWLQPVDGELTADRIAQVVAARLLRFCPGSPLHDRLGQFAVSKERQVPILDAGIKRIPYFCSGCPHNTSTRVPEGSRALSGIGCHFMAQTMNRNTATFTHMGGEGASWIGQAPFTETRHVFANLGDGTYTHSGLLAIRAAAAAGVNITYKILFNDAVAMTGGQPAEGRLTVPDIAAQVSAEGARSIRIVTDDPDKYPAGIRWPRGTKIHHRDDLDQVQRALRDVSGLTVLIFDQTCAAEKRRRRRRNTMIDPPKRIVINELVCEGCGDCGETSNCVSITPVETMFGRKRTIDQSSCNKDYACTNGFCPSFVSVTGGKLRKAPVSPLDSLITAPDLPVPVQPEIDQPYNIIVAGIGGTGIVTVGALIGMAAHLEGKGVSVLDMTGLAQKGGAVISHIRIADQPDKLQSLRVSDGNASMVLACDMLTATSAEALSKISRNKTTIVVNTQQTITGAFTHNPDLRFPAEEICENLKASVDPGCAYFVAATRLATRLLGDSIAANLFMVGYAMQIGRLPISPHALDRAIALNGVAVEVNRQSVLLGRLAAHDLAELERLVTSTGVVPIRESEPFAKCEELIAQRVKFLTAYQNRSYANRYLALVRKVEITETETCPGLRGLTEAVARYAFKLMAYKDEYEVARLYTDGTFLRQLNAQFEGRFRLEFSLAPPLISRRDPETGQLAKRQFGSWVLPVFRLLASLRWLRGTAWDPFGRTDERKSERRLIEDYFTLMDEVLTSLTPASHAAAIKLASVPEHIRGYGHVKNRHMVNADALRTEAMEEFQGLVIRNAAPE